MRDNKINPSSNCYITAKLGDLCEIVKGNTAIQKAIPGDYPLVVTSPQRKSNSTYQFDKPSVIIPLVSSRGHGVASLNQVFYQDGKFAVGNILACATPKNPTLDARYLCAYLNLKKDTLLVPLMTGGANVSLTVKTLQNANIQIPLPPLSIQQEIVSVLDSFTTLIDKMKQEVEKRKKQMEYYREKLLTFDDGECALSFYSYLPRERIDATELDEHNYVSVENLLKDKAGKTISESVPTEGKWIKYEIGDILIGNIRPYLKKIWLADRSGGTNGDVVVIRKNENSEVNSRYLYYVLSSDRFFGFYNNTAKGGKMPRGDKNKLMDYCVHIPPLSKQLEIVSTLDKFESYISKLEKMIALRQKQYEYYREQLLTFE